MTVALLMATAGLMRPATHFPPLGSSLVPSRAAIRLTDEQVDAGATDAVWPKPAKSVAELQQAQLAATEEADAKAQADAAPFQTDEGGFSPVAFLTLLVFVIGGGLFFQGISGGGAAQLFVDNQSPEVQACVRQATTRGEASLCLPPVPLE